MQMTGEIQEMERTVACLRKAIQAKEAPLKVAMTRLEERTRRVDVELCKDPAMQGSVFVLKPSYAQIETTVFPNSPSS